MKYYIIAGEASGDLHGSNLIKELITLDSTASIRCWGGELMSNAGATLIKHYRDLAFMGFAEVIKNLPTILKNFSFCKKDIEQFQPDVLILIDYPGFNLRMAKWAKNAGFKVIYYISPQIWAWKENRVHDIKKYVDKMLVILPFEKSFYKKWNFEVDYVGHPLVEIVDEYKKSTVNKLNPWGNNNIIALLPGSRKQEILKKLPIMMEVAERMPNYTFIVAKAPGLDDEFYDSILRNYSNVKTIANKTYELLSFASVALVTSGTATLETALFDVPEIICYKGSSLSYQIAKRLISIKYICLVNLIMDKEVVKELIQDDLNVQNLLHEIQLLLKDDNKISSIKKDYSDLKNKLTEGGSASKNAAKIIHDFMLPPLSA